MDQHDLDRMADEGCPHFDKETAMYRVWIDYKDGTGKTATVPDLHQADNLRAQWESEAPWKDAGFALIPTSPEESGAPSAR